MVETGFDPARFDTVVIEAEGHDEAILEMAAGCDAVVMHEAEPSLRERIFGTLPDRLRRRVPALEGRVGHSPRG